QAVARRDLRNDGAAQGPLGVPRAQPPAAIRLQRRRQACRDNEQNESGRGGEDVTHGQAARGESLAAFDRRCIPKPPQRGCRVGGPGASGVAPPSNTPGIATPPRKRRAAGAPVLGRRALPAGRLARLGATPDFHHGLLRWLTGCALVGLGLAPLAAHHVISAKFDSAKTLTLRGPITAIDWANPH